jgi:uncharacterized protein YeaO (DUF488 family)
MLRQESINSVRAGILTKKQGYLVAGMCYYPRGLRKELIDEYNAALAPDRELFGDWKDVERMKGHDAAFTATHYEERFQISAKALEDLRLLTEFSKTSDVFLLCQCEKGERCHREMLMLLANAKFGAEIDSVFHSYPKFIRRFS